MTDTDIPQQENKDSSYSTNQAEKKIMDAASDLQKQIIQFQKDTLHEWETGLKNVGMIHLAYKFTDELESFIAAQKQRWIEKAVLHELKLLRATPEIDWIDEVDKRIATLEGDGDGQNSI